jgi:diguanylate cyclase (GGDEF)-like protein
MMEQEAARELEQVVRELEFRTTVTTAMLSTLDLDQILYVILCGITSGDGLGFNRAFLFLTDEAGRTIRVTMALGPASREEAHEIWERIERNKLSLPDILRRYESYLQEPTAGGLTRRMSTFQLPMDRLEALALSPQSLLVEKRAPLAGVLARCLVSRTPFASSRMRLVQELGGPGGEEISFSHLAIAPLLVADKLIGAILADNIYTQRAVGSESLRSLYAFGNLAALAIDRARLHRQTLAMAEVDGLTGVYNRRFYQQELERILKATQRRPSEVSIVVFDLDHFKFYNDQYGHLVGDELLKDVARLITDNVRAGDTVARYGGEEFVVLVRDTPADVAAGVAEKLCALVKSTPLARGRIQGLTLSAGLASSVGSESVEELFDRADRALYRAKATGRDKVVVWSRDMGTGELPIIAPVSEPIE